MTDCLVHVWAGGRCRVAQQGEYAGYPSVTLNHIVAFCKEELLSAVGRTRFIERVRRCTFDDAKVRSIKRPRHRAWKRRHPCLAADGSDVLRKLLDQTEPRAILVEDCRYRLLTTDYAYVLDLDQVHLEVYRGCCSRPPRHWERFFPREAGVDPLATETRLLMEGPVDGRRWPGKWYPPSQVVAYHLEDLPCRDEIVEVEQECYRRAQMEYTELEERDR